MEKINVQAIFGFCSLEEQTLLGVAFDYMFVNITHPASDAYPASRASFDPHSGVKNFYWIVNSPQISLLLFTTCRYLDLLKFEVIFT